MKNVSGNRKSPRILSDSSNTFYSAIKIIFRSYSKKDLFVICLFVSFVARTLFVVQAGFPVNDGGLFYSVVEEIARTKFHLPVFFDYNNANIPFAYPPFGFFAAAIIAKLGIPTIDIFHYLPLLVSFMTVGAFYYVAKEITGSNNVAGISTVLFANMPRAFEWLIMGAGLTRSFGFLFALLSIWQTSRALRTGNRLAVVIAGVFTGLTILSHPEQAIFALSSEVLLWLKHRTRYALIQTGYIIFLGLCLALPWARFILSRHGLGPFLSSFQTGEWGRYGILSFLMIQFLTQSSTVVFVFLQLCGLFFVLGRGGLLLPLWSIIPFLLSGRSAELFASVPFAIMAGVFVAEYVFPRLGLVLKHIQSKKIPVHFVGLSALASLVIVHIFVLSWVSMVDNVWNRNVVTQGQRNAMEWIGESTPKDSAFIVVNDLPSWLYMADSVGEWFPALTGRVNVSILQGYEWALNNEFIIRQHALAELKKCLDTSVDCYELWAQEHHIIFTHFFIVKRTVWSDSEYCCPSLIEGLSQTSRYEKVYENQDVSIWLRSAVGQKNIRSNTL